MIWKMLRFVKVFIIAFLLIALGFTAVATIFFGTIWLVSLTGLSLDLSVFVALSGVFALIIAAKYIVDNP